MMDNESDIIEFDYDTNEYIQDVMFADGKSWDRICNRLNELFDEAEQLKQFKDKTFDLFDKEITQNEEAIEWGKETGADYGSMGFYTNMLKILRKELQRDEL